jgi:hypothetical protein
MAAALWVLGARMRAPVQARWLMIGLLYVLVLGALIVCPTRRRCGSPWGDVRRMAGAGWAGRRGLGLSHALGRVKARATARKPQPPPKPPPITPGEAERYARHILLREIGGPGQAALKEARVLVIGAGGLGVARAAISGRGGRRHHRGDRRRHGRGHEPAAAGDPHRCAAGDAQGLSRPRPRWAQNPFVTVRPYNRRLTADIAADLFADYDLILDGSDNFDTRYLVNRAARRGQAADRRRDHAMGRAAGPVAPGGRRAVLRLRVPRTPRAGPCAHLRRGGRGGPACRASWAR